MKLAVVIITYNRVEDARINMELIRNLWSRESELANIEIIHVFNGNEEWYQAKYLEDTLIRLPTMKHFDGAGEMIDVGVEHVLNQEENFDYIMVLSADTWIVKPKIIAETLKKMKKQGQLLASSLWFTHMALPNSLSTEFFVIAPKLARKIFPLRVETFAQKHRLLELVHHLVEPLPWLAVPKVELVLTDKIWQEFAKSKSLLKLKDKLRLLPHRKVVWMGNRHLSPSLGYLSHHNLEKKLKILKKITPEVVENISSYPELSKMLLKISTQKNTTAEASDSGRPLGKA